MQTSEQSVDAAVPHAGSCLCRHVRYAVDGPLLEASHCHCSRCRKQHGAAFATYGAVDRSALRIEGEASLTRFSSSEDVVRSFCTACGSSLFWEHSALPGVVWIALGTLDSDDRILVDAHIWTAAAVPWCSTKDDLPRHTEGFPVRQLLALMDERRRHHGPAI